MYKRQDRKFEQKLPEKVADLMKERHIKKLEKLTDEEAEQILRDARERRRARDRSMDSGWNFRRWMHSVVVEGFKNCIQAMFYACDYSTKPNQVMAPLIVAVRDGIQRLEEQLRQEDAEEMKPTQEGHTGPSTHSMDFHGKTRPALTKVQEEARRRLIRQATAAHHAIVKGSCLMVMQLLTGREVIRTHFPWPLMKPQLSSYLDVFDCVVFIHIFM